MWSNREFKMLLRGLMNQMRLFKAYRMIGFNDIMTEVNVGPFSEISVLMSECMQRAGVPRQAGRGPH